MAGDGYEAGQQRELGDGLRLRWARASDMDALAEFNACVHGKGGWCPEKPCTAVGVWTRDLMSGTHPSCQAGWFALVEEAASGRIVSTMNLIPQTWFYEGIAFRVGRPELVGTHPDYRGHGLVREQMAWVHGLAAHLDCAVCVITGIPYFYRQFGYEMALEDEGGRSGYVCHVPELPKGESEAYTIRPANEADLVFVEDLYNRAMARCAVWCRRDAAQWRHELSGADPQNSERSLMALLETPEGKTAGFLIYGAYRWGEALDVRAFELADGADWFAATQSVLRHLKCGGGKLPALESDKALTTLIFDCGSEHPAYQAGKDYLPWSRPPYAVYMRVPDLAGFLGRIAPALEKRLAASPFAGHTDEIKISFYSNGIVLRLDAGRVAEVKPWTPSPADVGHVGFPGLTFLQILFGYRSLEELRYAFPDCWTKAKPGTLLDTLFPKRPSAVWPFG